MQLIKCTICMVTWSSTTEKETGKQVHFNILLMNERETTSKQQIDAQNR